MINFKFDFGLENQKYFEVFGYLNLILYVLLFFSDVLFCFVYRL